MPRQEAKLEINQFIGGLNTDATELTTPKNTTTDEDNFEILKEGTRRRRRGIDLEDATTLDVTAYLNDSPAQSYISNHRWKSVAKDGDLNFEVVQVGQFLFFFDVSISPLIDGVKTFFVNLNNYKAPLATRTDLTSVSCASGKGVLFVTGETITPFYISYSKTSDDITVTVLNLKIRDLTQLDTTNPEAKTLPLSPQRRYDLLNQGWYQTGIIIGQQTQVISIKTRTNTNVTIPGYPGAILDGYIGNFGEAPPKTKPWWVGKGSITADIHVKKKGVFNDTKESKEIDAFTKEAFDFYMGGNTVAPLGHYILDPFYKDRTAVSGCPGLPVEVESRRPTAVAFYGGRAFYGLHNTIYFSQVIRDDLQAAERCYQEADPASQDSVGLVASDGGQVTIPDMGAIIRLFVVEGALLVFADNGVWSLYSGQGRGFSGSDFSVDFVTNLRAMGYHSIVDVEGYPVYWGEKGIFSVVPQEQRIAYNIVDISDKKIRNFYATISSLSKRYAKGGYDQQNKRIIWLWKTSSESELNRCIYDNVLNFSVDYEAWFPYSVSIHEPIDSEVDVAKGICGIVNASTVSQDSVDENVVSISNGKVLAASLEQVIVTRTFLTETNIDTKFMMLIGNEGLGFGAFSNETLIDWVLLGDGANPDNYTSYLETFYHLSDDSMLYMQAPWIYTYVKKTSNIFPSPEGDGTILAGQLGGGSTGEENPDPGGGGGTGGSEGSDYYIIISYLGVWDIGTTYNIGDVVKKTNIAFYYCDTDGTVGADPSDGPGNGWRTILFPWNTELIYPNNAVILGNGIDLYQSTQASNLNHEPTSEPSWWNLTDTLV